MKQSDVVFKALSNGYFFIQDKDGFINVFDKDDIFNENSEAQCVHRSKTDCKSQKDFEVEVIYITSMIDLYDNAN